MGAAKSRYEVSDAIVGFDPATLARLPVSKQKARQVFVEARDRSGIKIIDAIPVLANGNLNPDAVDRLLIDVHCERQRLSEEFQHGQRTAHVLRALVKAIRAEDPKRQISIADVGCANGFGLRHLAATNALGPDVKLIGVDFNPVLIAEAKRLAEMEDLDIDFRTDNALTLEQTPTILMSTGVLHHLRGEELGQFFVEHDRSDTQAFVHFDFQPTALTIFGAWLMHQARVELQLTRHDGVYSALRAHPLATVLNTAQQSLPAFRVAQFAGQSPLRLCTLPATVGIRSELFEHLNLGRRFK